MNQESRNLLIVEDDPGLLSQLKWCFEGYDVVTAEDRVSAINELRRHEPTVVLQDLGLPPNPEGVDEGLATLQELLKLSPHTKVIVVTGHGDQENALKSVALGAYDFYQNQSIPRRYNCWLNGHLACPCWRARTVACMSVVKQMEQT